MSYFAVIREPGPSWIEGKGAFEQPGVEEHASFMNSLADDGVVLVAGPLLGGVQGRFRALLIIGGDTETEIRDHLAEDPWARAERLVTTSVEPWSPVVGEDRLTARR